jgi:polysaccharide biosynthesis protein PslF
MRPVGYLARPIEANELVGKNMEHRLWSPSGPHTRVGIVSTYPPTRCGIARFSASLFSALAEVDPSLQVDILRLVDSPGPESPYPVSMEFDPAGAVGVKAAVNHLNRGDIAVINHEFGIFGPEDGRSALDLAEGLQVPAFTIMHTVLSEPTSGQRAVIQSLASLTTPVVLCEAAREILVDRYAVSSSDIEVIPHGAHWSAQRISHSPRRQLITWGLLGPGKGLEESLAALAQLGKMDPPVRYQIVGRTHPNVVRNAGLAYRQSLDRLIERLGLDDRVEFIDRYVSDEELFDLVRASDLVVVPYRNQDQVSSGVITEAIGMGRPVVATRFPYSEEILESGAGLVVEHDVAALANGIETLLEDSVSYRRAAREAAKLSGELSWSSIARKYSGLIHQASPSRVSA